MTQTTYDSIVIGAGSAGIAFATTAAKLGADVLIIERDKLGGTCVNRGCVPKKIMWSAGQLARASDHAASQEITTRTVLDYPTLIAKRDAHIEGIRETYSDNLDDAGVTLLRGKAELKGAGQVAVDSMTYTAEHIVLACGGRPSDMDISGKEHLSNSNDVLGWAQRPETLTIIGGGYIGCEFAAIFNALGTKVTLVHHGSQILESFGEALGAHVQAGLEAAGVRVLTNDSVTSVAQSNGKLEFTCKSGMTDRAEAVVAAAGRTPNSDQLGAFAKGLELAETGALAISDRFETSTAGIYAIGDVANRLPLTPVATADGTTLAHMLYGDGAKQTDLDLVATTAFVYPPAAYVGDTEAGDCRSDEVTPLAQNIMSPLTHDTDFYRLNGQDGALTGVALSCDGAENVIAMAAALIAAKAPLDAFGKATAVHPSFAEEFFIQQPK